MADARIYISVSRALGAMFLNRAMAPLATRFPRLVVELVSATRDANTSRREAEIALRRARPAGGELVARRMNTYEEMWLVMRPDVARLAQVRAVVDHLAAVFQDQMPGSEAA
jgi:DNA-binding transcriptional LysR family regulator